SPRCDELWLALHFQDLPLAVFDARQESLVITDRDRGQRLVVTANKAAREAGIEPGLSLSAAYALDGNLMVMARDEQREQALLERLACWGMQFSSQVSLQGGAKGGVKAAEAGRGLLIEVGRSLRLFGGLAGFRQYLDRALERLDLSVSHAMAPTPSAAWAMCQVDMGTAQAVTDAEALRGVLGRYPIECLELDEKNESRLIGMGVRRLADLWRLPQAGLAKRFGKGFVEHCRRLLGDVPEPRVFHSPPPRYEGALPLARESRNSERLLQGMERLLEEMHGLLHAYDAGVREIEIGLWHEGCPATRFMVRRSRASRDPKQWLRLIGEHFSRLQLPLPVCELGLRASRFESTAPLSMDLFDRSKSGREPIDQLIERLQARLGSNRVRGMCSVDDHRPEKAMRWCQPGEYTQFSGGQSSGGQSSDEQSAHRLNSRRHAPKRPIWLLPEPHHLGELGDTQLLYGPERIESGWWDGHDIRRDYWIAQNAQGARCWVFQDRRSRQWYLHGWFA
ncbi:MAG: Y-family DNA polymerase, partial [Gammaproteobacteria bacterium]